MGKSCPVYFSIIVVCFGILYYTGAAIFLISTTLHGVAQHDNGYHFLIPTFGAVIHILSGILLFLGVHMRKDKCILAYLVICTTLLILGTIRYIHMIIETAGAIPPSNNFLTSVILVFIWICHYFVYVFYKYIRNKNELASDRNADRERDGNEEVRLVIALAQPISVDGQNGTSRSTKNPQEYIPTPIHNKSMEWS